MADKIRGITIEIGGDTSGLSKSLTDANKSIKDTQKQIRDVNSLLKNVNPGNVELLNQKQTLLTKSVEETNKKLQELVKAEQAMKDAGVDETSDQFLALRREIISTEDYLNKAKKDAENFNVGLEKASVSAKQLSDKAGEVAEKTKLISAAAAGVVVAIGGMAVNAMRASDDLNTLAQQTGFTTEELQKFEYASELVDVSSDTIVGAVKRMKRNMGSSSSDVSEAWQRIGVSVKDANGEMRNGTEVFYDAVDALSKIGNETERDQLAMQLFGKSADSLAGIIDDGGKALKEYGDQALIWSQESIDASNRINDIVDKLKADIGQTLLVTGAKALEALSPVIEKTASILGKVLDFVGKLDSKTIGIVTTIAAVVASISPIAGIISKVSGAVSTLLPMLSGLSAFIPIITAAAPWVALAAAIAAAVALIIKNWDKIKEWAVKTWEKVKTGLIEPIQKGFESMKNKILSIWDGIVNAVTTRINAIIDKINNFVSGINNLTSKINNSKLGQSLGIDIGKIPTIPNIGPSTLTNNSYSNVPTVNNYNFNVDSIETYQQIENRMANERRTTRMGYVGG